MYDHGGAEPAAPLSLLRPLIVAHYAAVAWRKERRRFSSSAPLTAMTVLYLVDRAIPVASRLPAASTRLRRSRAGLEGVRRGKTCRPSCCEFRVNSIVPAEPIELIIRSILPNEACQGACEPLTNVYIDCSFSVCLKMVICIRQSSQCKNKFVADDMPKKFNSGRQRTNLIWTSIQISSA